MSRTPVKPWARGALELLQHAEEHRLGCRDFDRRVALIGFDNAIESSVITYLSLNPVQRGGHAFPKTEVERWLANFHTKVEFLEQFANLLQKAMPVGRPEIIYYHSLRNDLYHNGNGVVPATEHIDGARQAALWTFSILFECDAEALLEHKNNRDQRDADVVQLSAATAFLESFIKTKNELSELLAAKNIAPNGGGLDRLLQLLQEDVDVPTSIVDATLEAEKTKELLVQGEEGVLGEAALRTLTGELGTVSEYMKQSLRPYQHEIVESAVSSTLSSAQSDGRGGVISQITGSGLSMTLVAYLARCRETSELRGLPFIVVVDRLDLRESLVERMGHFPGQFELTMAAIPNSTLDLKHILDAPGSQLVVTTLQMLRTLGRNEMYAFSCLIVCFNLGNECFSNFDLKSMFPRGNFILFESTSVRQNERKFEIFGGLIRTYDYPTAVEDGFMLPVRIERHVTAVNGCKLDFAGEGLSSQEGLRAEEIHGIASDLLNDFRTKMHSGICQAVLVTKSRASVTAFAHALMNLLADQDAQSTGQNAMVIAQLAGRADIKGLYSDKESPIVWLSTVNLLTGIDLGPCVTCYVACKVSQSEQRRLVSLVARPRTNTGEAVIVDYAGNQWDKMLMVTP